MSLPARALRCAIALAALAAPLVFHVPAGSAAPAPRLAYDALGDSYASGYGAPPYLDACGRSPLGYPGLVNGRARIQLDAFVACAGATTVSTVTGGQLAALSSATDLVTLSDGGNDIGWSSTVGACLVGTDAQCAGAIAQTQSRVAGVLPGLLDSLYSQVRADAPNAEVIVTGYPRLFSPEYGAYMGASPAEQVALNSGADQLDAVIAAAAARHGFDYVSVTNQFVGHGVNSPEPWLHGALDQAAFHPTPEGYEVYAGAVTAAVKPGQLR